MYEGDVVWVSNAAKHLPYGVVYNLAVNSYIVSDNCIIYLVRNESFLRLAPVQKTVPRAYEELLARYGTKFKIFFIVFKGSICRASMFRFSPYIDTIAHGVINERVAYINQ